MGKLDYGRQQDLEELAKAIKTARSNSEREHFERIAYRLLNESPAIRYLREELIKATRSGADNYDIQKIIRRIWVVRQDETYGKSWGNSKGNKMVN